MIPRVTRWGITRTIAPFYHSRVKLPKHSYCPLPLLTATVHEDSPPDPAFERSISKLLKLSLERKCDCEFALHPMLLAQIRSVRDEAAYGPYVEWFSNESNSASRLFITASQDAFSYIWSPRFFSWLFPPFDITDSVVTKLIADRSRGAVIVRTTTAAAWFRELRVRSWLMFDIKGAERNFTPTAPAVDLTVFMIDPDVPAEPPQTIPLTLPANLDTFRPPRCPFVHDVWKAGLAYYPDSAFVTRILRGIKFGCSLSYHGPRLLHRMCKNPVKYTKYETELSAIIRKDEGKGFRCGPFPGTLPPLFNLICNPISGAPKRFSPDDIRMVKDMSYPHDKSSSVNDLVTEGVTRNITVRMICNLIATLGKGTLIWTFDVQSAYKQIKVIMDDWHLQGEISPVGFAWASVCDFGGRNSGHRWEEFGSAIEFMIRYHTLVSAIMRYVDDFIALIRPLIGGKPDIKRAKAVKAQVTALCSDLGVPIPEPKQKGPDTRVVGVLGWTIDTMLMELSVTDERRRMCLSMLSEWLSRSSASMHDLQSLVGLLQYLVECFRWGKAFLGHAIKLSHSRPHPLDRVRLSDSFRADMDWWVKVIREWNGISLFYEIHWVDSCALGFEVDASRKGHGAYATKGWYSCAWSTSELHAAERSKDLSMPFLEALAIAYGCATFGHAWSGKKIYCLSDCQPAEEAINARYSRDPGLRQIIRSIGRLACRFNFDLRVRHIEGLNNVRADPLSRLDVPAFLKQAPLHAASLQVRALVPPDLTFAQ